MKKTVLMAIIMMVGSFVANATNFITYDMGNETFLHRPTGGAFYPHWNHAADKLAYMGNTNTVWTIDPTNVATAAQLMDSTHSIVWSPLAWSPNDEYVLFTSSAGTRPTISKVAVADGTVTQHILKASDLGLSDADIGVRNPSVTIGSNGTYWMSFVTVDFSVPEIVNEGVYRIQIEADGTPIIATAQKLLGNFALFINPVLSPDGDNLLVEWPLTNTTRRLYLVKDLNSATLPITSFSGKVIPFTNGAFYVTSPQFSQDGTLIFYSEDINGAYSDLDPAGTIPLSDFEVILVKTSELLDGSPTTWTPVGMTLAGNQALVSASEGGTRLAYIDTQTDHNGLNISTLAIEAVLALTEGGQLIDPLYLTDGAGTSLTLDTGTQISSAAKKSPAKAAGKTSEVALMPKAGTATITMTTPITPVEEIQQPPTGNLIRRDLGEDGLVFDPPGTLVVKYTDAEIEGLDESTLSVITVNADGTTEEATVISRDLANNMLTVQVVHFSEFVVAPPGSVIEPDADNDGLSDAEEATLGTNPNDADSDDDGLNDHQEVWYDGDGAYNPYNPDSNPTGTDLDANDSDTDNDGMNDGQENTFGSDPLDGGDMASVPATSALGLLLLVVVLVSFGTFVLRRKTISA
ncbi:MAG: hypothetical protein HUU49_04660 [Candidatus Buchananbacteria bacterium]|nr:hypothetical protein [Candidatus Buchananbacteria bacterium]